MSTDSTRCFASRVEMPLAACTSACRTRGADDTPGVGVGARIVGMLTGASDHSIL